MILYAALENLAIIYNKMRQFNRKLSHFILLCTYAQAFTIIFLLFYTSHLCLITLHINPPCRALCARRRAEYQIRRCHKAIWARHKSLCEKYDIEHIFHTITLRLQMLAVTNMSYMALMAVSKSSLATPIMMLSSDEP